ncbi:hypothetical protein EK904_005023 [Melospiza melodia maxima]|nr:hypothetical protein EK904_005023 [Melospiza melodia maxima]
MAGGANGAGEIQGINQDIKGTNLFPSPAEIHYAQFLTVNYIQTTRTKNYLTKYLSEGNYFVNIINFKKQSDKPTTTNSRDKNTRETHLKLRGLQEQLHQEKWDKFSALRHNRISTRVWLKPYFTTASSEELPGSVPTLKTLGYNISEFCGQEASTLVQLLC